MATIHTHNEPVVEVKPANKEHIGKIWKTAGILGLLTAIEFIIAFTVEAGAIRIAVFIGLTIVKAFYIVAEFMHMKYETKSLIWSVLLPTIFVVWLIVVLLVEGGDILNARY
jgi:cytochrome c oxidase subunit IV